MPGCLQSPCASSPDFPERLCCNLSGNSFVWYHIWYQFPAIYHYFCTAPAVLSHNPSCRNSTKNRRTNEPVLHSAEFEEVTTRFELVNEGFADLCLTTWPRHHMSRNHFLLFFWSGRRGSNSLPPPWQGGALPDELRPHDVCSLRRTYKKMVPPIGIEPMTRGFSVPCSTN